MTDVVKKLPFLHRSFDGLTLLPILVSNLYSIYGLLFLNWRVSDIFFWFWCDLLLIGGATILARVRIEYKMPSRGFKPTISMTIFSFSFLMLYATIFTGLAYKGEWYSWSRFGDFLDDKIPGLISTMVAWLARLFSSTIKSQNPCTYFSILEFNFARKSMVVLGIYAILMFQYHWTGAQTITYSHLYLLEMGLILIVLKFCAELGLFDWVGRLRKRT